jgi:gluconolactonase
VTRTEVDGSITVLADNYQGKRLNSPNDAVVKSDGTVWFTDPAYGIDADYEGHKGIGEIGACHVYRFDRSAGTLEIVADDFVRPNGIAFSPDEEILYVSDTGMTHDPDGPRHIRAFVVEAGRHLRNDRVFAVCEHGLFDGFRLDTEGNLWTSAGAGVNCYDPAGDLLGRIPIPEPVSNVTFGGPKRNRLFIATTTSLYAVYLNGNGAQRP